MNATLDESTRDRVEIMFFRRGVDIAAECGIGAGSVTNIVNEWTNGLDSSGFESMRELLVQLKKEGMTFVRLTSFYRGDNYIEKLAANDEQIESMIANLLEGARSLPPEEIVDLINQLFEISRCESISLTEVHASNIRREKEGDRKISRDFRRAKNRFQIVEEYKRLREELEKIILARSFQFCRRLIKLETILERSLGSWREQNLFLWKNGALRIIVKFWNHAPLCIEKYYSYANKLLG